MKKTISQFDLRSILGGVTLEDKPSSDWCKGFFVAEANTEMQSIMQERIAHCVNYKRSGR